MMTQEEYVNEVLVLKHQGRTVAEISRELGYHPATISKWLKAGGPSPKREIEPAALVVDEAWAARIRELIRPPADKLLATSVHDIISSEGFPGSYPTVVRFLRDLRGPRFRAHPGMSVPIETAPGQECQFDWSDCSDWTERWGLGEVWCFGAILCWSRWRYWWFTDSIDAEHTFEGLVAFFEAVGGVPGTGRTDRMGALGMSQGRRFRLHPNAVGFARHHGIELRACQAGDAKRKGKCERPFRDLKESFLTELDALGAPRTMTTLNALAPNWLERRVHQRPHSTTGAPPAERLEIERRFLSGLPRRRFDTAYVEDRRVHPRLPLVEWDDVRYSVPPEALGSKVVCRLEVGSDILVITYGSTIVARHRLEPGATEPVWDPSHRRAAEKIALGRHGLHLLPRPVLEPALVTASRLELGPGDYDVDPLDLSTRYGSCGCTGKGS